MDVSGIVILVISFVILIAIGVPIAYSIGISGTLTMLASRPGLRERFGIAARRRAKHYAFPRMVRAYESYYQTLSPGTGTRPLSPPVRTRSPVIPCSRSIHERLQCSAAGPTFALKRH